MVRRARPRCRAVWPTVFLTIIGIMSGGVSANGSPSPYELHGQTQDSFRTDWEPKQALLNGKVVVRAVHGEGFKGLNAVGSRPPSCHHKCGGCIPCAAIQVPTNTNHVGIQYANYEPEGWKCKCGSSFYNP